MNTYHAKGHYPLVPAKEYLELLERYKNLPNIRSTTKEATPEKNKPKENFWKALFSVKTLINVWMPTVMTVAGTLGGAIIGAKYNTPTEHKHKPHSVSEKRFDMTNGVNKATYVFNAPHNNQVQFAVVGQKGEAPQGYWITTNDQGLKEVLVATQAEQVVLKKE